MSTSDAPTDPVETQPLPPSATALHAATQPDADTTPLPAQAPVTGSGADPADEPARPAAPSATSDTVWSARTLPRALTREPEHRTPRSPGLLWGALLLVLGVLTTLIGSGIHLHLITAVVIVLAGAAIALLLVALLPRRGES